MSFTTVTIAWGMDNKPLAKKVGVWFYVGETQDLLDIVTSTAKITRSFKQRWV